MNEKLTHEQNNPAKPANDIQVSSCPKCGKDPCACSGDGTSPDQKIPDQKTKKARPKKISWI